MSWTCPVGGHRITDYALVRKVAGAGRWALVIRCLICVSRPTLTVNTWGVYRTRAEDFRR